MATAAIDIITRSLRQMKVLGTGETPSDSDAQDMLTALNEMLEAWANDRLLVYVNSRDTINLTTGVSTYTVGPSGGTVTERPVQVSDASYITYNGVDYPVRIVTQEEYNAFPKKDVQGIPFVLYPDMGMPDMTVYLYLTPSANMTLNLLSQKVFTSFASLTTAVNFPPGYTQAIVASLSEIMAPEFGVALDPQIMKLASLTRKKLKRINTQVPVLDSPADIVKQRYYIGFGFI